MKSRTCAALLLLLLPSVAMANPIVSPTHTVAYIIVVGTSFLVEVAVTTGYLALAGMSAGVVFVALVLVNLGSYMGILLPALDHDVPVLVIELLVVLAEGVVIKFMSAFPTFQGDTFTSLKWRHAFAAAGIGNAFSYWVGKMIS